MNRIDEKITYRTQILNILEQGAIKRKALAQKLGIDPRNLNRELKPLLETGLLKKEPTGREVELFLNKPEPEVSEPETTFKVLEREATYQRDLILNLLKSTGREMHRLEIAKMTNINQNNIDRSFNFLVKTKQILKRKQGKFTFYRLPQVSFNPKKSEFITTLEVFIDRIDPLKEFLKYQRHTLKHSDRTIENYAREIIHFYKWKAGLNIQRHLIFPVEHITIQDITNYMRHLEEEKRYSENSLASAMAALKAYFRDLKRLRLITENILEAIPIPNVEAKRGIDFSFDEFKQMVKVADADKIALLFFLLSSGVRVSEAVRLSQSDINWDHNKITIHESKAKTRNATRIIDVPQDTLTLIREYIDTHRPQAVVGQENAVFISPQSHRRLSRRHISNTIHAIRTKAGIDREITTHSFRRACARMMWEGGMLIEVISRHLGHNNIQTTWGYINPREKFLKEQYQKAHPLENKELVAEVLQGRQQ